MTSDAQRAANRANAQKSTGPTSPEGKKRSRMNALKHGGYLEHNDHVTATFLREDEEAIAELRDAIVADLDPQTVIEEMQARAIAQKMLNQYRVDRLAPHLASDHEPPSTGGPTADELEVSEASLCMLVNTFTFRDEPAEPHMRYDEIAKAFHDVHRKRLGPLPPVVDPDLEGVKALHAWRELVCEMVIRIYGDYDTARSKIMAQREHQLREADRLRREIAGSEARRLVQSFSTINDLQDRVGRMITRDLKAYRDLQADRLRREADTIDPRNEPNSAEEAFPESTDPFPDNLDVTV